MRIVLLLLMLVLGAPVAFAEDEPKPPEPPKEEAAPEEEEAEKPVTFDPWLRNPRLALPTALKAKKDMLFLFTSTDQSSAPYSLETVILKDEAFLTELAKTYVLVYLDHPKTPAAAAKATELPLIRQLMGMFALNDTPAVVLTTMQGHPYARLGYEVGQTVESFKQQVESATKGAAPLKKLVAMGAKGDAPTFAATFRALAEESSRPLLYMYSGYNGWIQKAKSLPELKMLAEIIEEESKIDLALRRNDVQGAAKALIAAKLVSGEKLLQSAYRFGSYLLQKGEYALAHEVTAKALADPLINRKDEEIREAKWRQLKEALFNLNAEAKKKLPK
ncbi:MAG: hypothetical protein QNJ98_04265 [Planctomycetota bacterium]|nr:hypothetical protein [Planctomycetota bacterium]